MNTTDLHITLTVISNKSNKDKATELHTQFAHPTSNKLFKLINSAGQEWRDDENVKTEILKVTNEYNTCQIYKTLSPRLVVGLPMALQFLECIAIDLKFYRKHMLLQMIDHATLADLITSKKPYIIIREILQLWISVYRLPQKFLSDNGGELANDHFTNKYKAMDINFKFTTAESPWSKKPVERHNLILVVMLHRILEESTNNIDIAVVWAINAKNSLTNVDDFSPYQLAIGLNLTLPFPAASKPLALTHTPTSRILEENKCYFHKASQVFIERENSERIKGALNHNIRTYSDTHFLTTDSRYFKREHEKRGSDKFLGQYGQQVLIKHGANYIRVHLCRINIYGNPIITTTIEPSKDNTVTNNPVHLKLIKHTQNQIQI